LVFLAFFSPVLFRGRLLAFGDARREFLPAFASPRVLWTSLLFGGFPLAAEPQNQTWYWIRYLVPQSPIGWNLFVIMAYVLSATFTYGYVYQLTRHRLAAAVSGIAYGMTGFLIALLPHTNIVHSAAWIPLTIWSLQEQRQHPSLSSPWFIIESFAVATAILAGHPQICVYCLELDLLFIIYVTCTLGAGSFRYFVVTILGIVSGLALASVQIIPSIELWRLSVRSTLPFQEFIGGSFPLRQSIQLLFPFIFGVSPHSFYGLPYVGYWNFGNLVAYVGILPLMLSSIALASQAKSGQPDTDVWFWLTIACLAFVLALGGGTPIGSIPFYIPGYNLFRVPARHFVELSFAVSIMAGLGTAVVVKRAVSACHVFSTIGTTGVLMGITALVEGESRAASASTFLSPFMTPSIVVPCAVFLLSSSCLVITYYRANSRWCQRLLLLTLFIDLGSFGWFCNWRYETAPTSLWTGPIYALKYRSLLQRSAQRLVSIQGAFAPETSLPPNLGELWNIPNATGYGSLIPSSISRFLKMSRINGISSGDVNGHWWSAENQTLDLLAVRYIFLPEARWRAIASSIDKTALLRWHVAESIEHTAVVENLRAARRAWLVTKVKEASPEAILRTIQTSRMPDGSVFDGSRIALIDEQAPDVRSELARPPSGVWIERLTDTRVVVRVRTTNPCLLVLSDLYYPGWRATIDGTPSHIYRTDYVLRGVAVPRGTHIVAFSFWPISVAVGVSMSAIGALVLLVTYAATRLPRTTTASTSYVRLPQMF